MLIFLIRVIRCKTPMINIKKEIIQNLILMPESSSRPAFLLRNFPIANSSRSMDSNEVLAIVLSARRGGTELVAIDR